MNNKAVQKRRMMGYFIEATQKIIESEGLESITVRKVADSAGYNISTIYNYFNNLDHLIFFSSMKYLKDYAADLTNHVEGSKDPLESYRSVWKFYCRHSFSKPKIYYLIFWDKYRKKLKESIREYYKIFPEDLGHVSENLMSMLLEGDIHKRDIHTLKWCASEGYFTENGAEAVNEMFLLVYQSMLLRIVNGEVDYTPEEATEKTLFYQDKIIESFRLK